MLPTARLVSSPSPARPVSTRLDGDDAPHNHSSNPYRFLSPLSLHDLPSPPSPSPPSPGPSHIYPAPPSSSSRARLLAESPVDPPPRGWLPIPIIGTRPNSCATLPLPCSLSPAAQPHFTLACIKPWIPIALWVATSLGFVLAISFWRTQVFQGLDQLSRWLQELGYQGQAILFILIFITTFPPFPLYSTLIVLSGYCYGSVTGAVISYLAALTGALVVFILSRAYLRAYITSIFARAPSLKRVVRAIEKRPNILFLVRLAPYPYNVMNVLLAASPTLTLRTYTLCTALSLFKVIVHTTIGASIQSFAEYQSEARGDNDVAGDKMWQHIWTAAGIGLCIGLFVYLGWVARRAVDEELVDDEGSLEGEMTEAIGISFVATKPNQF